MQTDSTEPHVVINPLAPVGAPRPVAMQEYAGVPAAMLPPPIPGPLSAAPAMLPPAGPGAVLPVPPPYPYARPVGIPVPPYVLPPVLSMPAGGTSAEYGGGGGGGGGGSSPYPVGPAGPAPAGFVASGGVYLSGVPKSALPPPPPSAAGEGGGGGGAGASGSGSPFGWWNSLSTLGKIAVVATPVALLVILLIALGAAGVLRSVPANNNGSNNPFNSNADVQVLDQQFGAAVPAAVRSVISASLTTPAARLSAYMASGALLSALNLSSSASGTNRSQTASVAGRALFMRAVECALYLSNGDASAAQQALAVAVYATLQDDATVAAFSSLSSSVNASVTTVRLPWLWNTSCDAVVLQVLNSNSTLIGGYNRTAAGAAVAPARWDDRVGDARSAATGVSSEYCARVDADVYYINGIQNSLLEAASSAAQLQNVVNDLSLSGSGGGGSSLVHVRQVQHLYNPENGVAGDLLECLQQKIRESGEPYSVSSRDVMQFLVAGALRGVSSVVLNPVFANSALMARVSDLLAERIVTRVINTAQNSVASTTAYVTQAIQASLLHGRAVLLVAHSQGNLYMNAAYQQLTAEQRAYVRLISVATPAAYVGTAGTSSPYATRTNDRVIQGVRLLYPSTLAGNVVPMVDGDLLHHNFQAAYLADDNVMTNLRGALRAAMSSLSALPSRLAGTGIVTITLTWGAQPDVDLHVYEPGGTHVFYANRFGGAGSLDVDDVTGFGPENYVVPCGTLVPGTYRFGVNYYSGSGPELATVTVSAGSQYRVYTQALTVARGSSGNNSPIMMGTVTVDLSSPCCPLFTLAP